MEPVHALHRQASRDGQPLPELSRVVITAPTRTIEGDDVPAGTEGTIVFVVDGGLAYDVEFADALGPATVDAGNVRPIS